MIMNGIHNRTTYVKRYDIVNIVLIETVFFQRHKELPISFYSVFKAAAE